MEPAFPLPKPRTRCRRGATLVEMAFLLPVFLMLVFGILDWGIAFCVHETVVHRANSAVRWAVVNDFDAAKIEKVFLYGAPDASGDGSTWFSLRPPTFAIDLEGTHANKDCRVVMTVSNYEWIHFTPFLSGRYFGRPITVSLPVEDLSSSE